MAIAGDDDAVIAIDDDCRGDIDAAARIEADSGQARPLPSASTLATNQSLFGAFIVDSDQNHIPGTVEVGSANILFLCCRRAIGPVQITPSGADGIDQQQS